MTLRVWSSCPAVLSTAGNCPNCVNSVADDARSSTANDTAGSSERQHVTSGGTRRDAAVCDVPRPRWIP